MNASYPLRTAGLAALPCALLTLPLVATPVANPDSYSVREDRFLRVAPELGVLENDIEDGPPTARLEDGVSNGLLQFNPDGSFTYIPDPDFSGTDSFTYRALGSAGAQVFTVDQGNSRVTITAEVSIPVAGTQSDSDSSSVTGSATARPTPSTAPFSTLHITDLDLNIADRISLNFSFAFGLASVDVTGGPGALRVGLITPGPVAAVDGAGNFIQNDNVVSVTGEIDLSTGGLASGAVDDGPQTINIDDQTLDFDGVITQEGNELVLNTSVSFSGQFDAGGNPIALDISGNIRATSPLAAPEPGNAATVTLNVLPTNDLPRTPGESYTTRGPLARSAGLVGGSDILVAQGARWFFLVDDTPPPADWLDLAFAAPWPSGPAQLGFDESDEGTLIGFGGNSSDKNVSTWFRHVFPVVDADAQGELLLRLLRDDGAIVYLNGNEVVRSNLAEGDGPDDFATDAISGARESHFYEFTLPASLLVEGDNILAVEVHQATAGSSDLSFDLELVRNRYAGGVLGNDTDVDSSTMTARIYRQPVNGSVQLSPDGSFSYTPDPGFAGTDTFLYEALDDSPVAETEVLPFGSGWSYLDDGSDQGTAWRGPAFDASSWDTGRGELGYGEVDQSTIVGFIDTTASDPVNVTKNATTYFRRSFSLGNPSILANPGLLLVRDDAAAVYLNGVEVYRDANLAPGASFDTFATGGVSDENEVIFIPLAARALGRGANVIAVEVHQSNATSSDLSFDLAVVADAAGIANLLPLGSTWRFLDNGEDLRSGWVDPSFDDSLWMSGPAILGFGNGNENTEVAAGSEPRRITTYFRTTFEVPARSVVAALGLDLLRDDGAAVYLNGTEIARDNLQPGAAFDTTAAGTIGTNDEPILQQHWGIDPGLLVDGTNVLAVEVHQASSQSSDIAFDLRLSAIVSASLGTALIAVEPPTFTDRDTDGMDDNWENDNGLTVGVDDADNDADGDHRGNLSEFIAGTDPQDATSLLQLLAVTASSNGNYDVTFTSVAGRAYRLQVSSDLLNWTDLPEANAVGAGPQTSIRGVIPPLAAEKVYFRAVTSLP